MFDVSEFGDYWLIKILRSIGADFDRIQETHPDLLTSIFTLENDVSTNEMEILLKTIETQIGNTHVGLLLAKVSQTNNLGLWGYLLQHSQNIEDFFTTAVKYYPLVNRAGKLTFSHNEGMSKLTYSNTIPTKAIFRHSNEWTLGFFAALLRLKFPEGWEPVSVKFANESPITLDPIYAFFGNNVLFDQSENSISFESKYLPLTYNDTDKLTSVIYRTTANRLMDKIIETDCFETKIRIYILKNLHDNSFSSEIMAKEMYMSLSTLKRRLKALNLTFSELKDDVTLYITKKLLSDTPLNINQIAIKVGYANPSALTHAFTRLTQETPKQFRDKLIIRST